MSIEKKNALLIAYNDLNNSGVPNLIYQTVTALSDYYAFDIVVFGENDYFYNKLTSKEKSSVSIIKILNQPPKRKVGRLVWHLFTKNRLYYKKILKLAKCKNYCVMHSFKEYDSWPFLKAAKNCGIEKRILHSTVVHQKPKSFFAKKMYIKNQKLSLKYSTKFIGVSDYCCKQAFPNKHYTVIYNGYDETVYNKSVKNKLSNKELVLTQLATFNSNKNQLFTIDVFKELNALYPNSKLKLIGKETEENYLSKMKQTIVDCKLNDCIEIIDGSNGVHDHFSYTTFTILPSFKEGAGITAIESQACGIKVFASTNVTNEMDAGGAIFLDLKQGSKFWAQRIFDEFKKCGNNRIEYDLYRFSKDSFKTKIFEIYRD